jgi:integrase
MAINKTAAGSYAVDFRDQDRRRVQRTFEIYRDAVAFEKEALANVQRREFIRPSNRTVKEVAEEWLEKKRRQGTYERNSLIGWKVHVESYIVPSFGAVFVQDLDEERIEAEAMKWNQRVSAVTANKVLTTLAAVLALAKRYKLIKSNPAEEAERLKLSTEQEEKTVASDEVYSKGELKKVIEATEPGTLQRIAVELPAFTGIRIGELLGATWAALDLKAGTFDVRLNMQDSDRGEDPIFKTPKTKSGRRTLPLSGALLHDLRQWKLRCPQSARGLVLVNELGNPLSRKAVSKLLDAAIEKAQVKRLTPHGLRHTFASLLIADGVPVSEVSHYLGHKNPAVTLAVYTHFVKQETGAMHNLAASILEAAQ